VHEALHDTFHPIRRGIIDAEPFDAIAGLKAMSGKQQF
jgi:hypothetical protein